MKFNWRCPFCGHNAVILDSNYSEFEHRFYDDNKYGPQAIKGKIIVCPNFDCKEYSFDLSIHERVQLPNGGAYTADRAQKKWALIPESSAIVMPLYIPTPIVQDYEEACRIVKNSPKASATLSRRCLQGMIRDFWGVNRKTLFQEINELKDKLDGDTWSAIDSLRKVGNIGAHMEADINLIVDVDEEEAELLIELIETLIEEWYVNRYERANRMLKIREIAANKDELRNGNQREDAIG